MSSSRIAEMQKSRVPGRPGDQILYYGA